ncbi:MAG: hypothetical protein F6K14_01380 [Symploca sp. SIO2C1]|nr:hypothetical protein [Symploca sp. SIO2C1]
MLLPRLRLFTVIAILSTLTVACASRRTPVTVNNARVCDDSKITTTWEDDCDNYNRGGYYRHPATHILYYSPQGSGRTRTIIEMPSTKPSTRLNPGSTVTLSQPVVVNSNGSPKVGSDGSVLRTTGKIGKPYTSASFGKSPVKASGSGVGSSNLNTGKGAARGSKVGGSGSRGFGSGG